MDELKLMSVTEPVPMSETEPVVVEGRPVTMRKAKFHFKQHFLNTVFG